MRPEILNTFRLSLPGRIRLWITKHCFGIAAYEASRAALYRPRLFSRSYYDMQDTVMRGRSEWTTAERELFASRVAAKLRCDYCRISHAAFAAKALGKDNSNPSLISTEVLKLNNPKVSVMISFLEKLTAAPWDMSANDVLILYQAGICEKAMEEAVAVCVVFNIGSRLGLALDFQIPSESELRRAAPFILKLGYKVVG